MWTDTSKNLKDESSDKLLSGSSSLPEDVKFVEASSVPIDAHGSPRKSDEIQAIYHQKLKPFAENILTSNPSTLSQTNADASVEENPVSPRHKARPPKKIVRSQSFQSMQPSTSSTSSLSEHEGAKRSWVKEDLAGPADAFPALSRQEVIRLHDNFKKEPPMSVDAHINPNSTPTMTTLFTVLTSLALYYRGEEVLAKTLSIVHQAMKELPWIAGVVLENIEAHAKTPSFGADKVPLLRFMENYLPYLNAQNIYSDSKLRECLKRISRIDEDLYTLIQVFLKDIASQELIQLYIKSPDKKAPLISHCWYVSTEYFIKNLLREALKNRNAAPLLLEAVQQLLDKPHLYHIHLSARSDVESMIKELPQQPPYRDARKKLLESMDAIVHDLRLENARQDSLQGFYYQGEYAHAFIEAAQVIESGHESRIEHVVDLLALDLKKIEALFLTSIPAGEFVGFKKGRAEEAPHLNAYIQHINALSHYVIFRVLGSSDPHIRARWYEFFLRLLRKSIKIGNYNTAFTLFTSLQNASLARLKATQSFLGERHVKEMEKFQEFFAPTGNYKNYREQLEQRIKAGDFTGTGFTPLLAISLKNFTFIDDGNPDHLATGGLNENKLALLADQHELFQSYQNECLSASPSLLDHRYHYNIPNEIHNECKKIQRHVKGIADALNELAALSEELEPRLSPRGNDTLS